MKGIGFDIVCTLAVVLINIWFWSYIMNAQWYDYKAWYGFPTFMTSIIVTSTTTIYVYWSNPFKGRV